MLLHRQSNHRRRYEPSADMPACPCCQGDLQRIWRRPSDRVASWFAPARRYRCLSFQCQWEGNIRNHRSHRDDAPGADGKPGFASQPARGNGCDRKRHAAPRTFVTCMVLSAIGVVFIVAATTTDWVFPKGTEMALSSEDTWRLYPAVATATRTSPVRATK